MVSTQIRRVEVLPATLEPSTLYLVDNDDGTFSPVVTGLDAIARTAVSAGAGARYVHTQSSAAAVWTISHNLGFRPVASVFTVGGLEVLLPEILHLSNNNLTITFDTAQAGSAAMV